MNYDDDATYHAFFDAEQDAAYAAWQEAQFIADHTPAITGSISTGTLRVEDLIPAFLDALRVLDAGAEQSLAAEVASLSDWDGDDAVELLVDIEDAINDALPEGWTFGAREGDGADFAILEDEDYWADKAERQAEDRAAGWTA